MIYEYVITPQAVEKSISDYCCGRALVRVFEAVLNNGLLLDLAGGELRKRVGTLVAQVEDAQLRDELRLYLEMLDRRNRFVSCDLSTMWPSEEDTWIHEAIAKCRTHRVFAGITSGGLAVVGPFADVFVPISDVSLSAKWRERVISQRVERKPAAFVEVLSPLLSSASVLKCIDPHMSPTPRYLDSLVAMLGEAASRPEPGRLTIELHAVVPKKHPAPEKYVKYLGDGFEELLQCAAVDVELSVWLGSPGPSFHNRFVLSEAIGVHIGFGLDVNDEMDFDDWCVLDNSHRKLLWDTFSDLRSRAKRVRFNRSGRV